MQAKSIRIPISILTELKASPVLALIDSGAQGKFINKNLVKTLQWREEPLNNSIKVYNVDGTPNELEYINSAVTTKIKIANQIFEETFLVTQIGNQDIILGIDWLQQRNPFINWKTGSIRINAIEIEELPDNEEKILNSLPELNPCIIQSINEKEDTLLIKNENGITPTKGSPEAAGLDLYTNEEITIKPFSRKLIKTGIKIQCPPSTYGRIALRSSLSLKGIDLRAGVIDADYTGEVKVLLINQKSEPYHIHQGDRIAQLIIEKIINPKIKEVDQLKNTLRGEKGFGSTGKTQITPNQTLEKTINLLHQTTQTDSTIHINRIETEEFINYPEQYKEGDYILAYNKGNAYAYTTHTNEEKLLLT
jgi:dUTP pyrophosphatase